MDVDRYSESHAISPPPPSKFVRDHKQPEEAGSGQEAMQSLDGVLQCIHNHARSFSCMMFVVTASTYQLQSR